MNFQPLPDDLTRMLVCHSLFGQYLNLALWRRLGVPMLPKPDNALKGGGAEGSRVGLCLAEIQLFSGKNLPVR